MNLDHNHITNEVRGVLCRGCNTGLGGFRDNPLYLQAAIDYLEQYKSDIDDTLTF